MTSNKDVLIFAGLRNCRNCSNKVIKSLKTNPEQICKPCLRGLQRLYCMHCKKDYHQLEADEASGAPNRCMKCENSYKEHGAPSPCSVCNLDSAFGSNECRHCKKDRTRYGTPIVCEKCQKCCAFEKPEAKKVGGKNLCFLCGREWKLQENRNRRGKRHRSMSDNSSPKKRKRNYSEKKRKLRSSRKEPPSPELSSNSDSFQSPGKRKRYSSSTKKESPKEPSHTAEQVESFIKENATLKKQNAEQQKRLGQLKVNVEAMKIQISQFKQEIHKKDSTIGEYMAQNHDLKMGLESELKKLRMENAKEVREQKIAYKKLQKKYDAIRQS